MADVSLYEAPVILEGHGRPNVFLAGEVGQKYKDLDSGLEWVCKGERGFIKVDGDDQSEMYNWELVESGGSTGGGVFIVNFTQNEDKSVTSDKTLDEITTAKQSGQVVTGNITIEGMDITLIMSGSMNGNAQFSSFSLQGNILTVVSIDMTAAGNELCIGSTTVTVV